MINLKKNLSWFFLVLILSPFILWYFAEISLTAFWLIAWCLVWVWFVFSEKDNFDRGLIFIVASVFIAIAGKSYLQLKEQALILDMLYELMIIVSSAIGGNLMASAFDKTK